MLTVQLCESRCPLKARKGETKQIKKEEVLWKRRQEWTESHLR